METFLQKCRYTGRVMLRIVLADDNVRAAAGLARAVHRPAQGFTCCGVAHNGRQALELALAEGANVVITDVRMPVMDGLELSRRLREALPGVSIIVVSAYDEFEYARSALAAGADGYILKPLDRERLRELIGILERIRTRRERRAAVLGCIGEPRMQARLLPCLADGDPEAVRRLVADLMAGCGDDFACAQEAGIRIVSTLHGLAERFPTAAQPLPPLLEELGAETSITGIVARVADVAVRLSAQVAASHERARHHLIGAIVAYLDASYADAGVAIRSLPGRFRVSASWLHHAFRAHTGTTPNAYLTGLRLAEARRLLEDGSADVAEAARRCGYRDPHYFARAFRRRYGLSPSDCRRLARDPAT